MKTCPMRSAPHPKSGIFRSWFFATKRTELGALGTMAGTSMFEVWLETKT